MAYSYVMRIARTVPSLLLVLACTLMIRPPESSAIDIIGRVKFSPSDPRGLESRPAGSTGRSAELDTLAVRVFLRSPEMVTTRRSGPITIARDIRDGVIEPAFEVIRLGDRVAITNQDSVPRRAFVFAFDRTHILGPLAPGATASITVRRFGAVELSTDARGAVRSLLFVAENPFVALVGQNGRFRMGGVPPGDYRVIAWRPDGYLGERQAQLAYEDSVLDVGGITR